MTEMTTQASDAQEPKHRSGKPLACGMLLLILVGVSFALSMWFWGREPHGPIESLSVIDDTRVVVLRKGFEERGYTHLGVWTAAGDMLWSEALFGVQEDPEISVSDELVLALVTEARGNPALHAFDMETGEFRWKVQQEPEGEPSVWRRTLAVGDTVAWLMGPGRTVRVIELATGEVRATVEPEEPSDPLYVQVSGDRLQLVAVGTRSAVVDARGAVELVDYPDADERPAPMLREGEELCFGHESVQCRRVPGLLGYARGDGVVWVHGETELGVLDATDLSVISGPFQVGELTER